MSADGYVIVYRDGLMGELRDKLSSDYQLNVARKLYGRVPAYRIRIRDKPARLDPAKAYADAGLRK